MYIPTPILVSCEPTLLKLRDVISNLFCNKVPTYLLYFQYFTLDETWQRGTIPTNSTKVVSMDQEKENQQSGTSTQFGTWARRVVMSLLKFIGPTTSYNEEPIENTKKLTNR